MLRPGGSSGGSGSDDERPMTSAGSENIRAALLSDSRRALAKRSSVLAMQQVMVAKECQAGQSLARDIMFVAIPRRRGSPFLLAIM